MPKDANDSEYHAGEIAVCVADENLRGVFVVAPKCHGDANKWQEEEEREQMAVRSRMRIPRKDIQTIIQHQQRCNNQTLTNFNPIYPGHNIYAVGTENRNRCHVYIIQPTQVEELAQIGMEEGGDYDTGDAEIDKVHDQDGDGGEGGDEEFVSPADVEEVVA